MSWLFLPDENLHPSGQSYILGKKIQKVSHLPGDGCPMFTLKLPPPRLALEVVSGLESRAVCCCVAVLKLPFTFTDRSRPGTVNSHKFMVILSWFGSILVLPLISKMGFVYYLAFLSLSLLNVKWRSDCQFVRMIVRAQWNTAVGEVASPLPSKLFTLIKCHLLWHSADARVWWVKCIKEAITGTVISSSRRVESKWKLWPPHAFPSPTHRTRVLGMYEANQRWGHFIMQCQLFHLNSTGSLKNPPHRQGQFSGAQTTWHSSLG